MQCSPQASDRTPGSWYRKRCGRTWAASHCRYASLVPVTPLRKRAQRPWRPTLMELRVLVVMTWRDIS